MSLILEALKKSEAERQRGRAPGLFVEQAPLARRRRERPPAWAYALVALLVALLAAFGWREWSRSQATPPASVAVAEPASAGPERPAPATPPPADVAPATAPAPAPVAGAPATVMAPVATPPRRTTVPTGPAETRRAAPAVIETTVAGAVAPPEDLAAPAPPAAAEEPAGLPRLADLSAEERAALPPLRLSMHVYAEDPAARFVILDGRRLGEGARVTEEIVLRGIDRDGIVIEASGRALRLPRP